MGTLKETYNRVPNWRDEPELARGQALWGSAILLSWLTLLVTAVARGRKIKKLKRS